MNAPPPPPPPPDAIKSPIPVANKSLLSSIEKGTKLKRVPETLKNDRSAAVASAGPNRNGSSVKPVANGMQSSDNSRQSSMPKGFSSIQSELASHIAIKANPNVIKPSLPSINNSSANRVPMKTIIPAPNQYSAVSNKPPPPPPLNKKPMGPRNSIPDLSRLSLISQTSVERIAPPAPVTKKAQPPLPPQVHSNNPGVIGSISKFPVTRVTSNPPPPMPNALRESIKPSHNLSAPPPVPNALRECIKPSPNLSAPPPVPQRGPSQSHGSSSQQSLIRPMSSSGNQYKITDRAPPPPPPPPPNQYNQTSSFDRKYQFPDEKQFPCLRRGIPGSRHSVASSSPIETRYY